MERRIANQHTMVGACITLAQSSDYKSVWFNQEPADFATDLAKLQTDYGNVTAKAAQAEVATGGAGDAKILVETALENVAYVLARALANHFKKSGDLDRLGKVNVRKSHVVKLGAEDLVNKTTAFRDLGAAAVGEPGASGRGVTAARVATLTAAIEAFKPVMNLPRGQIVNRGTLLREVETDVAALVEFVADMDDLVIQFDGTDLGKRFITAWKRARIIVDSGGGHGDGGTATPPTTSPQ